MKKAGDNVKELLNEKIIITNGEEKTFKELFTKDYLVLYFYPKDNTPGCTKEACNLRDNISSLEKLEVTVVGISRDSSNSHQNFTKKFNLPFPLISDNDQKIMKYLGVGDILPLLPLPKRVTFLIDKSGNILHIWDKVEVQNHSEQIAEVIKSLKK